MKFMCRRSRTYAKERYGKSSIFRAFLFGHEFVVIGSVHLAKKILSQDDFEWDLPVDTIMQIFGNGIEGSKQPYHPVFRKSMGSALNPVNLKLSLPAVQAIFEKHLSHWLEVGVMAIDQPIRAMVVEVALSVVANLNVHDSIMQRLCSLALSVQKGLVSVPLNIPGTTWYNALKLRKSYIALLKSVIGMELEMRKEMNIELESITKVTSPSCPLDTTKAILEEYAEMKRDWTNLDAIAERVLTNVVGASETTGSALFALLVAISSVPGIMEKLREEQEHVLSTYGAELSYEVLNQHMPFLDSTIREGSRVLPSTQGIFRKAGKDVVVDGIPLTKGTKLLISFNLLHALDDNFEWDPCMTVPTHVDIKDLASSFKPERWLDDSATKAPSLFSFGYGPHSCLGMRFAILEMKMALCILLRKGTWDLIRHGQGAPEFVLLPNIHLASGPAVIRIHRSPLVKKESIAL
ncbi:hypothetical protein CEUSTIGMA_g3611.t1 [Chlamydomonas eustigma]|uniref:Cytochrome P450 n=1 Tax=Chlamydomonas eustigma TaxID=1157962 RepID=A0A250WZA0_9CHLO|nr:hypothetical protein CEUSTIGMA_g3611.t1 [Chlamydomonas eustigma]|eukprot:GAX76167.1 hypothetical protein CEUSTIGMA_g3611.t1 [Chlamydomonas eustigma]